MDKVNLTAKEARQISSTIGKKWIVNKIFKEISSSAMRGDTSVLWDFENSESNMNEVANTLENCGYSVIKLDNEDYVVKISW